MQEAKQKSLQDLMSLMDDQILSRFKPKGKPAPMQDAPPSAPLDALAGAPDAAAPEGEDPEALRQLMDMYGKEDADEDYKVSKATPMA